MSIWISFNTTQLRSPVPPDTSYTVEQIKKDNFLRTRWQWVFIYRWLTMAYGIHGKRQNVKSSRLFSAIFIPLQWKHLPILFTEDFFPLRKKQGTIMLENKTRMNAWDNIGPNGLLYTPILTNVSKNNSVLGRRNFHIRLKVGKKCN